jgi:signal transduction histidine kinase
MSLELYHKLMQDEDLEEEVVCEEGEECPVEEEEAVEEANTGSILAAILHVSVQLLNFALPLTFWLIDSSKDFSTAFSIKTGSELWTSLGSLLRFATHSLWFLFTTIIGVLVFFMDLIEFWDTIVNQIGFFISAIIALINIVFFVMIVALASSFYANGTTRLYIDLAIYTVGQLGYLVVVLLLSEDAKAWFMNNLGLTADEACPEEAQECVEAEECEDPEAEDCTYEADLALYEACTEFNAARDECIAAAEAAALAALEEACASCEGDDCPEDCPEEDAEEDEEEAFFF